MIDTVKDFFAGRPIWMNGLMLFCGYMTFIYMPFDLFYKPVADDQEIWFGYMLTGWAAKATEPIHWAIYGVGFYGFLKMKSWMFPWAALYVFQIAIAMGVFGWLYGGAPIQYSLIAAIPFIALGVVLWRAKATFAGTPTGETKKSEPQNKDEDSEDG